MAPLRARTSLGNAQGRRFVEGERAARHGTRRARARRPRAAPTRAEEQEQRPAEATAPLAPAAKVLAEGTSTAADAVVTASKSAADTFNLTSPTVVAALLTLGGCVYQVSANLRSRRLDAEAEREAAEAQAAEDAESRARTFREPVLAASIELQERCRAVFKGAMCYNSLGAEHVPDYAVTYTAFVIASFLATLEQMRLEDPSIKRSLDPDNTRGFNRRLSALQESLRFTLASPEHGELLAVPPGIQRAIGECMLRRDGEGTRIIGFGEFASMLKDDNDSSLWFRSLVGDLEKASSLPPQSYSLRRLVSLQRTLVDLIVMLDPGPNFTTSNVCREKLTLPVQPIEPCVEAVAVEVDAVVLPSEDEEGGEEDGEAESAHELEGRGHKPVADDWKVQDYDDDDDGGDDDEEDDHTTVHVPKAWSELGPGVRRRVNRTAIADQVLESYVRLDDGGPTGPADRDRY